MIPEGHTVADAPFTPRRLRVENVARRTDAVWLFTFVDADGGDFAGLDREPGQVAVLSLPDVGQAYMAIASPPHVADRLEFLVKNEGAVGSRLCDLGHEADVQLVGLAGTGFPIDRQAGRDLIFVAAGTAIAPMRSAIAHAIAHRASFGRIVLVHGVRRPSEFAVDDEIDAWRAADVDIALTVTQPGGNGWRGAVGRVQGLLASALDGSSDPVAFVCGSNDMMNETTESLVALGLDRERIFRNS